MKSVVPVLNNEKPIVSMSERLHINGLSSATFDVSVAWIPKTGSSDLLSEVDNVSDNMDDGDKIERLK